MGAGKSTVGACLAEIIGWRFIDLDKVIEAGCAQTVAQIFRERGEAFFRAKERQAIEELSGEERIVLALGGGAVEDKLILAGVLNWPETCMVFLDAPLPELLARIWGESHTRPLLTSPEDLHLRHQRRLPLYRAAHLTVVTTGLTPPVVAANVMESVSRRWSIRKPAGEDESAPRAADRGKGDRSA